LVRVLLSALVLAGCPRKVTADPAPNDECTKFGESCLFAPGKLGVCVERSTCPPGERCLTCQSQH
jgi:hypothetical protein